MEKMKNYKYEDKLQSERLMTRKLVFEDHKIWTAYFEDPENCKFFPNVFNENPEERAIRWVNKGLLRYQEQTYGLQALIHKETGAFIGQCGLLLQEIDSQKELEVGYHILRKYWGQGYAPEAARLFLKYAFDHKLAESVISIIHVDNIKSQRVADKNGLKREKETQWNGYHVAVYRIHASEFV
jgi:RimJ/RimL family protein N-acetyltransferase